MKTILITILLTTFLCACKEKNTNTLAEWKIPIVIDTLPSSDKYFETKNIRIPQDEYIYIGAEKDTIFISKNSFNINPFYSEFYNSKDSLKTETGIELIPDISQNLTIDEEYYSIPPPPILLDGEEYEVDEKKTDSIYKIWKNRPRNYVRAFPVFIRNSTKDSLHIDNQDGRLFMIQEAKDQNGVWKPIEFWIYSDCGNSYATTSIGANDLIIIKKLKYSGSFKTELRLKLKTNAKIIYSKPFNGSINKEQFDLKNIDYWIKDRINDKEYLDAIFLNK